MTAAEMSSASMAGSRTLRRTASCPDNGTIWMAIAVSESRRIVLEAVLDYRVCFIAEAQTSGLPLKLEKQWGPTEWARPRMPRTANRLEEFAEEIIAWVNMHPSTSA